MEETQVDESLDSTESSCNNQSQCTFVSMHITDKKKMLLIEQASSVGKVNQIPIEAELTQFVSMKIKLTLLKDIR